MRKIVLAVLGLLFVTVPATARIVPFPPGFKTQSVETNGTKLYVRVGGKGPAVVLLHGFADTGDMWGAAAAALAKARSSSAGTSGTTPMSTISQLSRDSMP